MSEPLDAHVLSEAQIDLIADKLTSDGYILLTDCLPVALAQALLSEMISLPEQAFKSATIGRDNLQQLNERVRSNTLHWLNGTTLVQRQYLAAMGQLREGLNRRLFMGLFDYECHYSHYAPGDFYKRHLDAFKGKSNRVLSMVLYLNPDWQREDEGELVLYAPDSDDVILQVEPRFNQCVIFLSDRFPHEVKVTRQDRYTIAGWYRINASIGGHIDPPR